MRATLPPVAAALAVMAGCVFSPGSEPGSGSDPDPPPCTDDIVAALSVDGVAEPPGDGEPFARVMVGDTVTLSAAGSCVQNGEIAFAWQFIEPSKGIDATILTGDGGETITVYPSEAGLYTVRLEVQDGGDSPQIVEMVAFEARTFEPLDRFPPDGQSTPEIRDLDVGGGILWIAAATGGFSAPLDDPDAALFTNLNALLDAAESDVIDDDLGAVHYAQQSGDVWFGAKSSQRHMWRVELGPPPMAVAVDLSENAEVRAIDSSGDEIRVAGRKGVFTGTGDPSIPELRDVDTFALAQSAAGRGWAVGKKLYDLAEPTNDITVFGEDDEKIRAVDAIGEILWLGSDSLGVARYDVSSGETTPYRTPDPLPSDKVRDIVVEQSGPHAGDVWVATDKGIARYKADREVWFVFDDQGVLSGRADVKSLVLDTTDGRRTLYAGTTAGLVQLRTD